MGVWPHRFPPPVRWLLAVAFLTTVWIVTGYLVPWEDPGPWPTALRRGAQFGAFTASVVFMAEWLQRRRARRRDR